MVSLSDLNIKIFADGADLGQIEALAGNPIIKGFTTNPTLMRTAGVQDYAQFAIDALSIVGDRPISIEVFSDEFHEMERQAMEIASWGDNVNVKIPVTNTKGDFSGPLIEKLSRAGVRLNVTALFTNEQVQSVTEHLVGQAASFVSVFAGRIADTGLDPIPIMAKSVELLKSRPAAELIWASPRELFNIIQADSIGCHVITATSDVLAKLQGIGKDLDIFSLETVRMFRGDAVEAGFSIDVKPQITTGESAES